MHLSLELHSSRSNRPSVHVSCCFGIDAHSRGTTATVKAKQTTMAEEPATTTSMAGCMIHDLVDLIQEKILKNRKSRNEEHWRTLKVSASAGAAVIVRFGTVLSRWTIHIGLLEDLPS
jgi:hypothetical protein